MKALKKIVSIFLILSLFICGCGKFRNFNLKPDDSVSRAVYDEVGEDLHYHGKKEKDEIAYEYQLRKKDAETISKFVKVINSVLEDKQKKVLISVFAGIPDERTDIYPDGRRLEEVFSLRNYSGSGSGENTVYDGLYELFIYDPDTGDEQFFPDPAVYTGIEGIKRLQIGKQMQQRAEEEGIDWYECWPDLEEMTIIGADAGGTRSITGNRMTVCSVRYTMQPVKIWIIMGKKNPVVISGMNII